MNWALLRKKINYFFSLFDYVKCADCNCDGKGSEVYCKPPLGLCIFEKKGSSIEGLLEKEGDPEEGG